jgi:hypothetical protein
MQGTRWCKSGGGINQQLVDAVKLAIAAGYRHLDSAEGNAIVDFNDCQNMKPKPSLALH